jgi:F-type H+-transporting ATPase subunit b
MMGQMVNALALFAGQGDILAVDATAAVIFLTALVLIWALNSLLFKPILQVLDERDHRTLGYHSEAKAMLAECDRKLAQYEAAIRRARAENYEMLEQRRKEALAARRHLMEAAKQEVAGQLAEARQQIQQQVTQAKTQLAAETQMTAQRIAATLLRRQTEEVRRAT